MILLCSHLKSIGIVPDPDYESLGGHQDGEGSRGPPRPPVGPGQSPGGGFRGAKLPDAK